MNFFDGRYREMHSRVAIADRKRAVDAQRNGLARTAVYDGSETLRKITMHSPNIIERAFELARSSDTIDEVRNSLRREGYSNVDAHLAGPTIKADLRKRLVR